jgi:hypothetical protein
VSANESARSSEEEELTIRVIADIQVKENQAEEYGLNIRRQKWMNIEVYLDSQKPKRPIIKPNIITFPKI